MQVTWKPRTFTLRPSPPTNTVCNAHRVFLNEICVLADLHGMASVVCGATRGERLIYVAATSSPWISGMFWYAICTNIQMVACSLAF